MGNTVTPSLCGPVAPDDLKANLTSRAYSDHLPRVSCGDSDRLGVLPRVRQSLADRDHERAGCRRAPPHARTDGTADRRPSCRRARPQVSGQTARGPGRAPPGGPTLGVGTVTRAL